MEGIAASSWAEESLNPFETLNSLDDPSVSVDKEQRPLFLAIKEVNEEIIPAQLDSPARGSSPSYVDMTRKKPLESSGSSKDETFERPSKKVGRKSLKEAREEEAERQKIEGSETTLKMSIGRNTRAMPPKGGLSTSI